MERFVSSTSESLLMGFGANVQSSGLYSLLSPGRDCGDTLFSGRAVIAYTVITGFSTLTSRVLK